MRSLPLGFFYMFAAFVEYEFFSDALDLVIGTLLGSFAFGGATLKGRPAFSALGGSSCRAGSQLSPDDAPTLRLVFGLGRP